MKREIKESVKTYYQDQVGDPRCVVEYLDDIHELLLKQERNNWAFYDYI